MPDTRLQETSPFLPETSSQARYRILRKGSRYNILGPHGRIFTKYQSASKVGPRWEELTCTPWPYVSSAYECGYRLWQLGLIERDQIGRRNIATHDPENNSEMVSPKSMGIVHTIQPKQPMKTSDLFVFPLALPIPKIDLAQHERLMNALRQKPTLLFTPQIQQALQHEVEYHRPHALWASHLLTLLARYERRQRRQQHRKTDESITAKHIEWQTEKA